MGIVLPLVFGFFFSAVGTALPGLINMTAAKISLREGRQRAVLFALGASTIVFFQAYIAVSFAKFINSRPDIIYMLQETGLVIFSVLTIYFLFIAGKRKHNNDHVSRVRSRGGNYVTGILLSVLNFFPIPYYVFISISLSAARSFQFEPLYIFLFVIGAVAGAFLIFYLYIAFFRRFEARADFFMRNINYLLGSVTGLVAIITLIKILRN